jgi:hypothetical protein
MGAAGSVARSASWGSEARGRRASGSESRDERRRALVTGSLVTGSVVELALLKGETGEVSGEATATGGAAGGAAGGARGGARGSAAGSAAAWGGQVTEESRGTLGKGEGTAHHAHSSESGVSHCDWYSLIGRYIKK